MLQSTLPCDFALPAEWEPQSAIMLTWPHAGTDWKPYLPEITDTYLELADIITRYEQLLVATPDVPATRYQLKKKLSAEQMSRVLLYEVESNDTWVRDHGPLTMVLRKSRTPGWCLTAYSTSSSTAGAKSSDGRRIMPSPCNYTIRQPSMPILRTTRASCSKEAASRVTEGYTLHHLTVPAGPSPQPAARPRQHRPSAADFLPAQASRLAGSRQSDRR